MDQKSRSMDYPCNSLLTIE
jgi:hypothetical protein